VGDILIVDANAALGGPPPIKGRFSALERGSTDLNRTISPDGCAWKDHVTGDSGDAINLIETVLGIPTGKALTWAEDKGLRYAPAKRKRGRPPQPPTKQRVVVAPKAEPVRDGVKADLKLIATYPYQNAEGKTRYEVHRYLDADGKKTFRQGHKGHSDKWVSNLTGVDPLPYRLPKVLQAQTVYLAEGEKDVEALEAWGLVASCNSGGAGSSSSYLTFKKYFRDKDLVILPDNDSPGHKHAAAVADALMGAAKSIKIVELPDLREKGDVSDWKNAGGTPERLLKLIIAAPVMNVALLSEFRARWGIEDKEPNAKVGSIRRIEDLPSLQTWTAQRVEFAVENLIVRGGLNMITGTAGVGKSMLAMYLMAAVAKGERFLGRKTEQLTVLLLDRENPAGVVAERFDLFGLPAVGVHAWGTWLQDEPPAPDSPIVLDYCSRNPSLVVIDTLIRFHGGDESSSTDTAAFNARCRKLAATGAAVVILHHTGKGLTGSNYRGSSDIAGGVDTAYALELNEGGKGLDSLRLRCFKFRVGEMPEPLHIKLEENRFEVTSDPTAEARKTKFQAVIDAVNRSPGISTKSLVDGVRRVGVGRNEADNLIRLAVEGGEILKSSDGRGGFSYQLAGALVVSI